MLIDFEPGDYVKNPLNKDWGIGQVQSIIGNKVTLSDQYGYDSQAIESMAFAWMGFNRINNQAMKVQLRNGKYNKGLLGSITQARP